MLLILVLRTSSYAGYCDYFELFTSCLTSCPLHDSFLSAFIIQLILKDSLVSKTSDVCTLYSANFT